MKTVWTMILVLALALSAWAGQSQANKDGSDLPAGVQSYGWEIPASVIEARNAILNDYAAYEQMKLRYNLLMERAEFQVATDAELQELSDICITMDWPNITIDVRDEGGNLDQGSTDTVGNCASATVIPPLAVGTSYSDGGVYDGDNDCSVIAVSPSNEVFYTFTPSVSGYYQIRTQRVGQAAAPAVRVVSGGCCIGAVNVGFSSSSVAADCGEPTSEVTYLRVTLTAGVQYWIHVGTSSSTAGLVGPYAFSLALVGCPPDESATVHNTCATAQAIAVGDSVFGDSAYVSATTTSDWYTFSISTIDSVFIFVGGRELGHCNSGVYPSATAIDGRYTLYGPSCTDSIGFADDEGCSFDAKKAFCLNPGTYYLRVWNFSVAEYVMVTRSLGACTTFPVDCATLAPCGVPAEVEPNGTCADAANILTLDCLAGPYFGLLCPGSERDYWYVPATTGTQQTLVLLSDGPNCSTFPPTVLGLRVATTAAGVCTTPSGSFAAGFIFGGCTVWPGGWITVDRAAAAGQSPYSLSVSCREFDCPCPDFSGDHQAQVAQGCAGKVPVAGSVGTASFFQTVVPQYRITDLDVCLAITHTFDGDLDIYLITPWGDTLDLTSDNGSTGDNYYVTTLDDEAAGSVTLGTAPFNGSYIPEELLAAVDGFDASGTWQLFINDDASGDSGYVHCWALNFTYDVILNAELSSFSAVAGDGNVVLNWATASENDVEHFAVERDGVPMANVAATNEATGGTYSWTDNDVTNGLTYEYSLYAVDINGSRQLLATESATPQADGAVVTEFALHQNYPNPFNPETSIAFSLPLTTEVELTVFNALGQQVATLAKGSFNAGTHTVRFDGTNLPSGLYFYSLKAGEFSAQHKMLLLK